LAGGDPLRGVRVVLGRRLFGLILVRVILDSLRLGLFRLLGLGRLFGLFGLLLRLGGGLVRLLAGLVAALLAAGDADGAVVAVGLVRDVVPAVVGLVADGVKDFLQRHLLGLVGDLEVEVDAPLGVGHEGDFGLLFQVVDDV